MSEIAPPVFELDLAPADVPILLRQPELRAPGFRRRPGAKRSMIWHDTPDGELAAQGLALSQCRGPELSWRLERMVPTAEEISPPGAAPTLVAEDPEPPQSLAGRLLPVAAFDGLTRSLAPPEGMSAILLEGELRAVAATGPICRVMLSGPGAAEAARAWAGRMRLSAPRASLPAEALALARRPAATRRLGAPVLDAAETVEDGFARIVAHLSGVILHYAPLARANSGDPEPVHQMRVALRRLRSAILLFRRAVACPELDDATAALKALGRLLGPPRDWDVFTQGTGAAVGEAFEGDAAVGALLEAAERRRVEGYAALAHYLEGPAFRVLGIVLADLALFRPWRSFAPDDAEQALAHAELQRTALAAFAARALSKRLQAVIAPGADLGHLSVEALHEIRLHGKRLRYAAEFFAPLFPGRDTRRFLRAMMALQERLGHLNDGAVATGLMAELPARTPGAHTAIGVVRGFVAAQTSGSRRKIERSWKRFLKQTPFWK